MKKSTLTFELQEIPEGKSTKSISLEEDSFELSDDISLLNAGVEVEFYRTDQFIRVQFDIFAETRLICDRTLKPFNYPAEGKFEVLFYPDSVEEHETEKGKVKQINTENLTISIDHEVRDTILLQIPVKKLHPDLLNEDGTPKEFEIRTFGGSMNDEDDDQQSIDPRWEKLKKLK